MKMWRPKWAWVDRLEARWTPLRTWKKVIITMVGVLFLGFVLIQAVPVDRSNPPVESDIPTPPDVKDILRTSCYDCHSNETHWPWYGYLAPVSWWMKSHLNSARDHLNFSTWDSYSTQEQELIEESIEEIEDGGMPPGYYKPLHSGSGVSDEELAILQAWATQYGQLDRGEED